MTLNILVNGCAGKMGSEAIKAVSKESDMNLVGAVDVDPAFKGLDAGEVCGIKNMGVPVTSDLVQTIKATGADIMIDFTVPHKVMDSIRAAAQNKCHVIVGTTGINEENLKEIETLCKNNNINVLVAPNFAIGAVLMMKFATEAVKYMPKAEIIELHHDQKLDAPSGTSIKTAEMMKKTGHVKDVPIHSVRLPGFVAHQEVIFGGLGQTLTIRHDSISRESFMPGVVMAARKIKGLKGLVYGLENIL